MARTLTESQILADRQRAGILVPLLEQLLEHQVEIEDEQDMEFMVKLMQARAAQREKGVFSPSMLGSCQRQAYWVKTGKEKFPATTPRSNFYFMDGNFRHYKWQFALWKAHRLGLLELLGVEIRVYDPNGDFAGTIDAIVVIEGEMFVVDFKGMHVRAFQTFESFGTPDDYRVQIVGYAMIVNRSQAFESFMGSWMGFEIKRCLLVGENKGGPAQRGTSQIALHEDVLEVTKTKSQVKRKIHALRRYVDAEEVPPISCTSVRIQGFQQCPFAPHCREEVKERQRELERDKPRKLSVRESTRRKRPGNRSASLPGQVEE